MNLQKDEVLKVLLSVCDPNTVSPIEKDGEFIVVTQDELLAFANAIADAQREKDAKICDEHAADYACVGIAMYDRMETGARGCAEAIRANKESPEATMIDRINEGRI